MTIHELVCDRHNFRFVSPDPNATCPFCKAELEGYFGEKAFDEWWETVEYSRIRGRRNSE